MARSQIPGALAAALATAIGCGAQSANDDGAERKIVRQGAFITRDLIVLAAPRTDDEYYAEAADDIAEFQIAFAREIASGDAVIVLTDEASFPRYAAALGEERVVVAPMDDIWMRDFSLSNAVRPVMFRYTAAGQAGAQGAADDVQETLTTAIRAAGLSFGESDLFNDGGNFVDDYVGRAVVSRKFLKDNRLREDEARAALRRETGVSEVAFIDADEQGGLEHADGVVAFIGTNTLVINSYPKDLDYAAALREDLEKGLPDVVIREIVTPYDGADIYDEKFGSACGLYTNMLVTPSRIYLPQFGIAEDAEALANIRRWTDKEVVPIQSGEVCRMGGGVRCMSWQLRGDNALRFLRWAKAQ
jgi:agmatine/peptidylarginine deiminase